MMGSRNRRDRDDLTLRISYIGMLVALGLVLQIVESSLPPLLPVPGAKLGLANLATLMALLLLGPAAAFEVTAVRCLLGALLRGSAVGLALSLSAGLAATAAMSLLFLMPGSPFSITGISIAGAAVHNATQLAVAIAIVQFAGLLGYLPYLLLIALPTGFFIGLTARRLWTALEPMGQPAG
ncbi:MAG: Gx transporter family protein [Candidatus Geothermincolia bacterium]